MVVGVFDYLDDTLKAVEATKEQSFDYRVYSPVPRHEIEEATFPKKSPVRFFTWAGGVTGLTFGFGLAVMCSLDYPLRVSAKDIVSLPGFFVIGYECMILFAALATFGALLHFCRLPNILRKAGFDPRFTDDKFGVVVSCERSDVEKVTANLRAAGAREVEVRDGL
jgi:hypothetical protein